MIITIRTLLWCLLWIVLSQCVRGSPTRLEATPLVERIDLLANFFKRGFKDPLNYSPATEAPTSPTPEWPRRPEPAAALVENTIHQLPGQLMDMVSTTPRPLRALESPRGLMAQEHRALEPSLVNALKPSLAPSLLALEDRLRALSDLTKHEEELTSVEKLARGHRAFDRMVQFVGLVGQVDSFIADQAQLAVRKLSAMYAEDDKFKRGY